MGEVARFRMGGLDHVHIRVPDRAEAAAWYGEHLGFETVQKYSFWADGFDGGPLQISADGGRTMLALFEATDSHPMVRNETGIAFTVDADMFILFALSLPGAILATSDRPLERDDLIDFDLVWAYELSDPWGNRFELNCDDYDRIAADLVVAHGVAAQRYWPAALYGTYRDRR